MAINLARESNGGFYVWHLGVSFGFLRERVAVSGT